MILPRHKSSSAAFLNALFIIYFLLLIFYISFEFVVVESSFYMPICREHIAYKRKHSAIILSISWGLYY